MFNDSQLVEILDSFLFYESKILLSSSKKYAHWHDLSQYQTSLQQQLIQDDKVCSPSLELGNFLPKSGVSQSLSFHFI